MNAAEILRALADKLESMEQPQGGDTHRLQHVEVDNTDHSEDAVMIAPLQQKQELLKKAAGVESFYDDECCDDQPADELDMLKRNAGMPTIVATIGGEENDIA
jgi:hypothetical protein